jgi:hypothetical protein
MLVTFHGCDKISEQINLRKEGFILAHSFRRFSPWSAGSVLWQGRSIMAEGHGRGKLPISWQPGSKKRVKGRDQGPDKYFKGSRDLFPPTKPHV